MVNQTEPLLFDRDDNLLEIKNLLSHINGKKTEKKTSSGKDSLLARLHAFEKEGVVLDVTGLTANNKGGTKTTFSEGGVKRRLETKSSNILYNVVYNSHKQTSADGVRNLLTALDTKPATIEKYVKRVQGELQSSPSQKKSRKARTPAARASPAQRKGSPVSRGRKPRSPSPVRDTEDVLKALEQDSDDE